MSGMDGGPLAPLERYLDATAVSAPPDLVGRIGARLLFEPPSTAPRRFFAALRALDARGILRGLGQNAATAFGPGTRSMLLRAQAMAVVLVTIASIGFGSVAGLAATQHVTEQVVNELAGRSAKGSTSSSTAPTVPVTPSVRRAEAPQAVGEPAGPAAVAEDGTLGVPGQACGLPANSQAVRLVGSEGDDCPAVPVTGRPPHEGDPKNPAADRGKAEPLAGKRVESARPEPPARAEKGADAGQGSSQTGMPTEARPSDDREAPSRPPKTPGKSKRDRS